MRGFRGEKFAGQRPFGEGGEKKIYKLNEKRVIALYKDGEVKDLLELRQLFYLQKIAHLLFPGNIPDMVQAGVEPSHYIAEAVEFDELSLVLRKDGLDFWNGLTRSYGDKDRIEQAESYVEKIVSKSQVVRNLSRAGILIEAIPQNFSVDPEGTVHYVDTVDVYQYDPESDLIITYDYKKLKRAIETSLVGLHKDLAIKYWHRLAELTGKPVSPRRRSDYKKQPKGNTTLN
jgi:hypothetical protein